MRENDKLIRKLNLLIVLAVGHWMTIVAAIIVCLVALQNYK